MSDWTTRLAPELTAGYGVGELHSAYFLPKGWLGKGPTIVFGIPECEMQYCRMMPDGEPLVCVNRPQKNLDVDHWLRHVCKTATEDGCAVILSCDTAEQAKTAATAAAKLLPGHERASLERMYNANTRVRSNLN